MPRAGKEVLILNLSFIHDRFTTRPLSLTLSWAGDSMNRLVVYPIVVFICFDRMGAMVDPTERLVVDSERYQNRDFSLRMKAFKARRNQTELLVETRRVTV